MPDWTCWRLTTAREDAEAGAQVLLDIGCDGVQIEDSAVLFDESEDATIVDQVEATITGYLPPGCDETGGHAQIAAELGRIGIVARVASGKVSDENWETSWREHFPPLHIGPFLIVPSWIEDAQSEDAADAIVIRLDPGLAFGTGQHPTTRMCLELLAEHITPNTAPSLLDVGCGSGILSLAAAKLGAKVTGSDLDTWCVRATRENAAFNDVEVQVVQAAGLEWTEAVFDIVVANLMSALLISLAPALVGKVRPGGTLLVSGISAPRADDVAAAFTSAGLQVVEKREQDGAQRGDFIERWTAFVLRK